MKKITYIKTSWCPYCTKADSIIAKLKRTNESYDKIEFEIIDEDKEPDKAAQYQYRLVPNMWIGKEKAMEGIPSTDKVKAVLDLALDGEAIELYDKNSRYENEYTEGTDADTTAADTRLPKDLPEVNDPETLE